MKIDQNKTPILSAIEQLIESKPAYFRIPGHRLEKGISEKWTSKVGTKIFAYDVTETPYTDDLHEPEGAILEAEQLYADLYQVKKSFLLVNGTTCGNEAMILSAVLEGEEIIVARNAHKSAMMGLILSGATPVYCMPQINQEWGLQGQISPKDVRATFAKHPHAKALFLVSPSYYGITSDLAEIAKICHSYGAMLLVDEAHGGHLYFHEQLPAGAMAQGADMCVQSMHKITGAMTQSSVLHVNGERVNVERVARNLHLVQSTSPNYVLMTSLDCARYELAMHGRKMVDTAIRLAALGREQINQIKGFICMSENPKDVTNVSGLDCTRLVISAKELGITGFTLDAILFEKYQVNVELSDDQNVLAVITYANTKEDIERLVEACRKIAAEYREKQKDETLEYKKYPPFPSFPTKEMTPRKAYFSEAEEVKWEHAVGRISAEMIAPYPPGIPVVYPGERITKEIWEYLECFRVDKRHIHGSKDGKLNAISVIKE